jgi:putative transposase
MDWMYDELFDGKRIWVLTVVDTWSRVCPVMRVCRSATAMVLIEALEDARRNFGLPHTIRVDYGCQFTSKEFDLWAYSNGITLDFSRPGKPTDNAYDESFNASARLECLGQHWFLDLDDATQKVEDWCREYNTARPHSALDGRTPAEAYWARNPVDMMDKADALPTSPQAQQQLQKAFNMNEVLTA